MSRVRRYGAGAALIAVLLLAAAGPGWAHTTVAGVASLSPHAPIVILGNAGFNATNGVVSGTGTATDPYLIANWEIDAPASMGVQIRNADAYAVIENVTVTSAPVAGFYTYGASNLTFSNVTASGGTADGMRLEASQGLTVLASNMTQNSAGIVVLSSSNVSLAGNYLGLNGGDGVTVAQSSRVRIVSNVFYFNAFGTGYGLDLLSSTNTSVRGNRFTGNDIYLDGTTAAEFGSHVIDADNLVSGLPILYAANRAGLTLTGLTLGELLIAGCTQLTAYNLSVSGGDLGVEVAHSSNVVLGPDVSISHASLGLRIIASTGVRFSGGTILETGAGVRIESSTDVAVLGSKISAPFSTMVPDDGVAILGSDRVNVSGSILRHHLNGISVSYSGNVSLLGNLVTLDTQGANLDGAWDVLVAGNAFAQEATGLRAARVTNATVAENAFEGITGGMNVSLSSGLRVVHNAFLADSSNAYDANGTLDAWDGGYPDGGNFWWTYHGSDVCSGPAQNVCTGPDGIGDNPYLFDVSAVDRYPLMQLPVATDIPPEALFFISSLTGTVLTAFRVSANASSDYEDSLNLLHVRWDWEGNGSWTPWTNVKTASHVYGVPGTHTIRLEVRDAANLTDTWSTQVFVAPKPDNLPPAVTIVAPASAEIGQPIVIVANITDASGVASAAIDYFGVDGGSFLFVPMSLQVNGVNFTATIPGQPHAGTLIFAIIANDTWENQARAPLGGYLSVSIVDPFATFVATLLVPALVVAAAVVIGLVWRWRRRRERVRPPEERAPPSAPPPGPPGAP